MAIGINFDDDFSYGRDDERDSQIADHYNENFKDDCLPL